MNKKVLISVESKQKNEFNEIESMDFITEGKYYKKGESYYITYKESEVTGMNGTTTTIKVNDNIVTLMRFGKVSSQMVFEKQKKHLSCYETEYGTFSVGVYSNRVNVDIDEDGGNILIDYRIELDNNETGRNHFKMNVKEIKQ